MAQQSTTPWPRPTPLGGGPIIAAGSSALLVGVGFIRFPNIHDSVPVAGLIAVAVAAVAIIAGLLGRHWVRRMSRTTRHLSGWFGLALAAEWVAYVVVTHLLVRLPDKPASRAALTAATIALTVAAVVCVSGAAASRENRWLAGLTAGLYTGLLAGLVSLLTIELMLDVFMPYLVTQMNGAELASYARSGWPDRQAWYYWRVELPGAGGSLIFLLVVGALAGAAGALAALKSPSLPERLGQRGQ